MSVTGTLTGPSTPTLTIAYQTDNQWRLSYQTQVAGQYVINVRVANEALSGSYSVHAGTSSAPT